MKTSTLPAQICKVISGLSYLLLILTLVTFLILRAEVTGGFPFALLAINIVPLAIFIPGLLRGSDRTHAWLCFVVLVYFTLGILEFFSVKNQLEGLLITLFTTTLFISSTLYIRWHKPEQTDANDNS